MKMPIRSQRTLLPRRSYKPARQLRIKFRAPGLSFRPRIVPIKVTSRFRLYPDSQ